MKRVLTVVGARPQFIKAAVLSRLIRDRYHAELTEYLVHTGQHYDPNMSDVFFRELGIPDPDANLGVGSGPHGRQTGQMLEAIEQVLMRERPDVVLVYGDTNSTLAGALAASKLHIPVAHVEAGLRSRNMRMPEEQNRVLTDHVAALLFCPTQTAVDNLAAEGIARGVTMVGDVMYDAALLYADLSRQRGADLPVDLPETFYLLTLHRAENTDDPQRLGRIVQTLNQVDGLECVFPAHPRATNALRSLGLRLGHHIRVIDPVGYLEMLDLERRCRFIVTDSGGVQKEAYFLQKPCVTLRDETEWVETVRTGWNTLVGSDPDAMRAALQNTKAPSEHPSLFGRGDTAVRIAERLIRG